MQFTILPLLLTLITTVTSLQTIRIGVVGKSCGSASIKGGQFIFWFSDSNVCTDAVVTGAPSYFTSLCGQEFTLLGHTGITFTGCTIQPYSIYKPSGVSDGGNPALTCVDVDTSNEPLTECENDCTPSSPRQIREIMYCS